MDEGEAVQPRSTVLHLLGEAPPDDVAPHGMVVEEVLARDDGAGLGQLIPRGPACQRGLSLDAGTWLPGTQTEGLGIQGFIKFRVQRVSGLYGV